MDKFLAAYSFIYFQLLQLLRLVRLLLTRLPKAFLSSPKAIDNDGSTVSGPIAYEITKNIGTDKIGKIDWQQFRQYLLQRMTPRVADDRIRYARQYAHVLDIMKNSESGKIHKILQLSPAKRLHVMKALANLARYTGRTEQWQQSWATGTEKIDAFNRFFDNTKDLDTMVSWLREALQVLPSNYANFLLFCTLTGLRFTEAVEAVRLLVQGQNLTLSYYDPEQHILQHYRFPELFIRRTKAVYISVVNDQIVSIARRITKTPTPGALKWQCMHRGLSMRVKYCRKIQGSFLRQQGIQPEIIDMLQGRIGENIFLRHYMVPSTDFKTKVLSILSRLKQEIEQSYKVK